MQSFIECVVRRRQLVLLLTFVVTIVLAFPLRRLENIVDTDSLHPQGHPYVIATKTVERLFGGHITMLVTVSARTGDIFTAPILTKIRGLNDSLQRIPGVLRSKTLSLASGKVKDIVGDEEGMHARAVMGVVPQTEAGFEALERRVERNPLLNGVLVSRDKRTAAIAIQFPDSPHGYRALEDAVEGAVAPYRDDSVELLVTGQPVYMAALEHYSARMAFLLPLAILVTALVHYEAFRTLQGLVLPLVTALLSVVWGLGIMVHAGLQQLDPFSNAAPILIIAVAAGHAVQILKRYYEAYHLAAVRIPDRREASRVAVVDAVSAIGPVMLAAGGIAAASFLSMLVFTIPSVRTFGVFAAAGVMSALVIELTFIPAIRAMLPPPGLVAIERERSVTPWDRVLSTFATLVTGSRRGYVFASAGALAVVMIVGAMHIRHDSSVREFFAADLPFRIADATINERLSGTNNLSVFVEGEVQDAIKDPATLKAMLATQHFLEAEDAIGSTISIANYVALMNRAMHGDDPAYEVIPDSADLVAQYLLLYSMTGDPGDFDSYVDSGYRRAVIQSFVKTDSSAYVTDIDRRLTPILRAEFPPGIAASIAGSMTTPAALSDMMVRGKLLNIAMVASVVLVLSTLLFRSLAAGLFMLVPLAMVALVNFGFLGWLGIPLQVATATVAALAIGVGADYAIYFTYRLRDEISSAPTLEAAVRNTYATAGKASLYVASAVGGGYAVLTLSHGFNVHLWLGGMVALAMFVSAISALVLYPALLLSLRPRFVFRALPAPFPAAPAPATILALLVVVLASTQVARAEEPAEHLMRESFAASRFLDTSVDVTMLLKGTDGSTRELRATGVTRLRTEDSTEMRRTQFESPSNIKGTIVLSVEHPDSDDDVWVYLPAMHKVRRIPAGQKRDAFVGTELSHGDVIGYRPEEWSHRLVRDESVDGFETAVIESLPGSDAVRAETGYSRRLSWIRRDNFCPVRSELYDESGELLKKYVARDLRLVDPAANRYQPMEIEMTNVQTGRQTTVRYARFEVGVGVSADQFTPQAIESGE